MGSIKLPSDPDPPHDDLARTTSQGDLRHAVGDVKLASFQCVLTSTRECVCVGVWVGCACNK